MERIAWCTVFVGSMMAAVLGGCTSGPPAGGQQGLEHADDPATRAFKGTIISLRPTTSTMLISKDEHGSTIGSKEAIPNIIAVKYDAQTRILLDDQPATLDQLEQYMTVRVSGHMRDGQLFAETTRFSSVLPANVRRADAQAKN
jgi:hypothetical protein